MCAPKPDNYVSVLDIILSLLTGGFWTLWMYYRPRRKK